MLYEERVALLTNWGPSKQMEVSENEECLRDALIGAIQAGNFEGVKECVQKLIGTGADINATNKV